MITFIIPKGVELREGLPKYLKKTGYPFLCTNRIDDHMVDSHGLGSVGINDVLNASGDITVVTDLCPSFLKTCFGNRECQVRW